MYSVLIVTCNNVHTDDTCVIRCVITFHVTSACGPTSTLNIKQHFKWSGFKFQVKLECKISLLMNHLFFMDMQICSWLWLTISQNDWYMCVILCEKKCSFDCYMYVTILHLTTFQEKHQCDHSMYTTEYGFNHMTVRCMSQLKYYIYVLQYMYQTKRYV